MAIPPYCVCKNFCGKGRLMERRAPISRPIIAQKKTFCTLKVQMDENANK
jgi:hypothetical protein